MHYRAHGKAHKCAELARMQVAHGSHGICCEKLCEAEHLAHAVDDIFITNEIVDPRKIARVCILAKSLKRLTICVDCEANVHTLAEIAAEHGVTLDAIVEVNVGQNRCGVETAGDAVRLAKCILGAKHLRFAGIQTYNGAIQHVRSIPDRAREVDKVVAKANQVLDALRREDIQVETVTGGGENHGNAGATSALGATSASRPRGRAAPVECH